jgi:hypothetical protein
MNDHALFAHRARIATPDCCALKFGPDAQSAFVRADPGSELDAVDGEEAALELTVARNVVVGAPEAVDDVTEQGCVGDILIDDVMDSQGVRGNRFPGPYQRVHRIGDDAAAQQIDARRFR